MAISVYTGVMGSGKTYEVVGHVIAPALAQGRRIVTNIAGFNLDEAMAYCVEKLGASVPQMGDVVVVDDDVVLSPSFFPAADAASSTVRPGDLVVIDECWRFWGADGGISDTAMEFFRKHRHLTDPTTGVACDLVLITQSVADLHRKLKTVVELSFRAKKAKSLGLSSVYVVEMWEGVNQRRRSVSSQTRKYDASIFPLYKSYSGASGAAGREMAVDGRQNILKSWRFLIVVPLAVLFLGFAIWNTFSFFAPSSPRPSSSKAPAEATAGAEGRLGAQDATSLVNASFAAVGAPVALRQAPPLSSEWRLSGFVAFGERRLVLLINRAGRLRYVSPADFSFSDGKPIAGVVDGERITSWSGSLPGGSEPSMEASILPLGGFGQ